jgi:hypothetical protein
MGCLNPELKKIVLWYIGLLILVYVVLLKSVGIDMALRYLGAGKGYAHVLSSFRELEQNRQPFRHRIFFFGDSTIAVFDKSNAPPAILERKLQAKYGANSVDVVDWAFLGATMFHYYCLICKVEDYSPSLIILPINYRTFGPVWQVWSRQNEEKQIGDAELIAFAPLIEEFSEDVPDFYELEGLDIAAKIEAKSRFWKIYYLEGIKLWIKDCFFRVFFSESPISEEIKKANRGIEVFLTRRPKEKKDEHKEKKDEHEIFRCLFPVHLSKDNKQYCSYIAFIDACSRRQIPVLFYFSPLNIKEMEEYEAYYPTELAHSIELFREDSLSKGGVFLDFSQLLPAEEFFAWEHYDEEGAKKVAEALFPEVERMLTNRLSENSLEISAHSSEVAIETP